MKKKKITWVDHLGELGYAGEIGLLIGLLILGLVVLFYLAIGMQLVLFWVLKKYGKIEIEGWWKRAFRILVFFALLGTVSWIVWKRADAIFSFLVAAFQA